MHELYVEARDGGTPARHTRVPLRIHVADANDNAPEIVDPPGDSIAVREGGQPGAIVARFRAVDRDRGDNATIFYTLEEGEGRIISFINIVTVMSKNLINKLFRIFRLSAGCFNWCTSY